MYTHFNDRNVGIIGEPFKGMGDFFVPQEKLKKDFGIETLKLDKNVLIANYKAISENDINNEIEKDKTRFIEEEVSREAHYRSIRTYLALEKWIDSKNIKAFSFNFLNVTSDSGFETVPFLAASKLMASGIGYAGEGDLLTASLVSSLMSVFPETSFTEMFCPDWKGNSVFLSHMGEMNPVTAKGKMDLTAKEYSFSDVDAPLMAYGCFKAGDAVLVNLAQTSEGEFTLILSKVEVLDGEGDEQLKESIRGWAKPDMPLSTFLGKYSMAGGTHHLVMVYGDALKFLSTFGQMMGFSVEFI